MAARNITIEYWWFACDVMAAMLVDRNNEIFVLWENFTCYFYANFVYKFSFILSPNMAAMQTTYKRLFKESIAHVKK